MAMPSDDGQLWQKDENAKVALTCMEQVTLDELLLTMLVEI
jgi:hypothetical protein